MGTSSFHRTNLPAGELPPGVSPGGKFDVFHEIFSAQYTIIYSSYLWCESQWPLALTGSNFKLIGRIPGHVFSKYCQVCKLSQLIILGCSCIYVSPAEVIDTGQAINHGQRRTLSASVQRRLLLSFLTNKNTRTDSEAQAFVGWGQTQKRIRFTTVVVIKTTDESPVQFCAYCNIRRPPQFGGTESHPTPEDLSTTYQDFVVDLQNLGGRSQQLCWFGEDSFRGDQIPLLDVSWPEGGFKVAKVVLGIFVESVLLQHVLLCECARMLLLRRFHSKLSTKFDAYHKRVKKLPPPLISSLHLHSTIVLKLTAFHWFSVLWWRELDFEQIQDEICQKFCLTMNESVGMQ